MVKEDLTLFGDRAVIVGSMFVALMKKLVPHVPSLAGAAMAGYRELGRVTGKLKLKSTKFPLVLSGRAIFPSLKIKRSMRGTTSLEEAEVAAARPGMGAYCHSSSKMVVFWRAMEAVPVMGGQGWPSTQMSPDFGVSNSRPRDGSLGSSSTITNLMGVPVAVAVMLGVSEVDGVREKEPVEELETVMESVVDGDADVVSVFVAVLDTEAVSEGVLLEVGVVLGDSVEVEEEETVPDEVRVPEEVGLTVSDVVGVTDAVLDEEDVREAELVMVGVADLVEDVENMLIDAVGEEVFV